MDGVRSQGGCEPDRRERVARGKREDRGRGPIGRENDSMPITTLHDHPSALQEGTSYRMEYFHITNEKASQWDRKKDDRWCAVGPFRFLIFFHLIAPLLFFFSEGADAWGPDYSPSLCKWA
jgi:hypothetical protein